MGERSVGRAPVRPRVEHFLDAPAFLRAQAAYLKERGRGFTYRGLAEAAGRSPGYWNLAFHGKRALDADRLAQIADYMRLTESDLRHLERLLQLDAASDPRERTEILEDLAGRKRFRDRFEISPEALRYLREWYILSLHMLLSRTGIEADPEALAARFRPRLTPREVREALDVLESLGIIERDADGGITVSAPDVTTPDELHDEMVTAFHDAAVELGRWALREVPADERNFGVVTGRLDAEAAEGFLDELHEVRHDLARRLGELTSETGDVVIQVNLQGFPVTRVPDGEE